ncbi:MAG: hypothetical protein AAGJ19_22085 [Myxococcota bacterium]
MKIYVASSWRNFIQPAVVHTLRRGGHDVYDFRNPPQQAGFGWEEIASDWQSWTVDQYRKSLRHPRALEGFAMDRKHVEWCDRLVLVLPCGRSAHLEAGVAVGLGKPVDAVILEPCEPELMYLWFDRIIGSMNELMDAYGVGGPEVPL